MPRVVCGRRLERRVKSSQPAVTSSPPVCLLPGLTRGATLVASPKSSSVRLPALAALSPPILPILSGSMPAHEASIGAKRLGKRLCRRHLHACWHLLYWGSALLLYAMCAPPGIGLTLSRLLVSLECDASGRGGEGGRDGQAALADG